MRAGGCLGLRGLSTTLCATHTLVCQQNEGFVPLCWWPQWHPLGNGKGGCCYCSLQKSPQCPLLHWGWREAAMSGVNSWWLFGSNLSAHLEGEQWLRGARVLGWQLMAQGALGPVQDECDWCPGGRE